MLLQVGNFQLDCLTLGKDQSEVSCGLLEKVKQMKGRGDLEFPWINIFRTGAIKGSFMFITVKGR